MLAIIMCVFVPRSVAQFFRAVIRGVLKMIRYLLSRIIFYVIGGIFKPHIGSITLRCAGDIDRCLRKWYPRLRKPHKLGYLKGGVCYHERLWIGIAHILGGTYYNTP